MRVVKGFVNEAITTFESVIAAGKQSAALLQASGRPLIYVEGEWVVRRQPDGRVVRLAPVAEFTGENLPSAT